MASSATNFDIKTLARELKSVSSRWFVLGIHLGVQHSDLRKIQQTYPTASVDDLLIHMLDSWFRSNTCCCWRDVITALRELNETRLADELESSYPTEGPTDISTHRRPSALLKQLPPDSEFETVIKGFDLVKYDDLKAAYAHLLTKLRQYLGTIDLDEVKFFISELVHDLDLRNCDSPEKLIEQLKSHVHVFKVSLIKQVVEMFPNEEVVRCLDNYQKMKQHFLCGTRIVKFCSQLPDLPKDMCKIHFKVTKATAHEKVLDDIDSLAKDAFGPSYNYLTPMSRYSSDYITWGIPKIRVVDCILWAQAHLPMLNEHGVEEVTVGKIKLCSCQHEVVQQAREKEQLSQQLTEQNHQLLTKDKDQLIREMEQTTRENEQLTDEMGKLNGEWEQWNGEMEETTRENEQLTDELEKLNGEWEQLNGEMEQTTRENEQLTGEMEQTTRENEQLTGEMEQTTRENEQLTGEMEQTTRENEQLTEEMEKLNGEWERLNGEMEQLNGEMEQTTRENEQLTEEMEKLNGEWEQLNGEMEQTTRENEQLTEEMEKLHGEWERLNREMEQVTRENEQLTGLKEQVIREKAQVHCSLQLKTEEWKQVMREYQQLQKVNTESQQQLQQEKEIVREVEERLTREKEQLAREKDQLVREKERLNREKMCIEQDLYSRIVESQQENQVLHTTITQSQQQIHHLRQQLSIHEHRIGIADGMEDWVVRREEVELTEEVVGRGGWGEVRVAKFRGLRVAAKFMHDVILSDYNSRLFVREMTMAAKLRHPHLLLFIGATKEGQAIILTELMPTSLRKELERRAMPQVHITSISQDVGRALCYLHQWQPHPIIHRDISSANVLLEPLPDGCWRAKVSDYGSANFTNLVSTTVGPGSLIYAAPEASTPHQHSPKMDVYSYGILLVEMCLREVPESQPERQHEQIQRIQWVSMVSLIRRCTSQRPAHRPTMSNVMDLLARM